jgi:hypothetical protein
MHGMQVSGSQALPAAFGGQTISDLVEEPISQWIEARENDWQVQQ